MNVKATVALLAALTVLLTAAPAGAHVIVESFLRTPLTVGQTGLRGQVELINEDPEGPTYSVCNPGECNASQGITLIPSCAIQGVAGDCAVAETGVFTLNSPAVGAADTACAGVEFQVTSVASGKLSFTPAGAGQHVLLPPLFRCRIEFTFGVAKAPSTDARADVPGLQTNQVAEVLSVAPGSVPAGDLGASTVTFEDAPPPPPQPLAQTPTVNPPAMVDTIGPGLSDLSLSPARFRAARSGSTVSRPAGSKVSYTLSEVATLRLRVERALPGRRAGGRCVSPRRVSEGARRCVRYVTLPGAITGSGRAGSNTLRFTGRLRGRRLRPGGYRLRAVATDAAGNNSGVRRKRFRVLG